MTSLQAVVRKAGFKLTLIRRLGRVAIYRQHLPDGNPDHDAYEVILPQVRHTNHNGEPVAPYESYPPAESWGKKAWTFTTVTKAVQKLKQLSQRASRTGTVSRRNRLDGQARLRSRLGSASRLLASNNFALAQRTKLPIPMARQVENFVPP